MNDTAVRGVAGAGIVVERGRDARVRKAVADEQNLDGIGGGLGRRGARNERRCHGQRGGEYRLRIRQRAMPDRLDLAHAKTRTPATLQHR